MADEWAKPEMGTGCVKITPAHDPNDYEVGLRRDLPMVNILNPERIIIGGGLSKMGDMLLDTARQVVTDHAFQLPAQQVHIVTSQLGDNAGILGAAALAWGLGRST